MQPSVHRAPLPSGPREAARACRPRRRNPGASSTRTAAAIGAGVLEHVRIVQADRVSYAEDPPYAVPAWPEAYRSGRLVLVRGLLGAVRRARSVLRAQQHSLPNGARRPPSPARARSDRHDCDHVARRNEHRGVANVLRRRERVAPGPVDGPQHRPRRAPPRSDHGAPAPGRGQRGRARAPGGGHLDALARVLGQPGRRRSTSRPGA